MNRLMNSVSANLPQAPSNAVVLLQSLFSIRITISTVNLVIVVVLGVCLYRNFNELKLTSISEANKQTNTTCFCNTTRPSPHRPKILTHSKPDHRLREHLCSLYLRWLRFLGHFFPSKGKQCKIKT